MCRITGGITFSGDNFTEEVLIRMRDRLSAGGPDSFGVFLEDNIRLAHRRLSILDLSPSGLQPMIWNEWVISYNGEIYNFTDLKDELIKEGIVFDTKTDTEVIIKAFATWGEDAVNRFRGMFAFALWNKLSQELILCRDRLGVKPLYWYFKDDLFLFASEIKSFHEHPDFDKSLDLRGLPHYFQKGFFHENDCIYKYVKKVPPGSFLKVNISKKIQFSKYWNVENIYENSFIDPRPKNEIMDDLEIVLKESFKLRMVADVEVGVFLSGGVDSSLVTALLQADNPSSLQTFTIGFDDERFNEAKVAEEVSRQLGTNHTTLYCTEKEFQQVIPELSEIYDEPFGDSSAIPTYLVSKLARKSVKVALSGDGGDELFGGYSKYKFAKHSGSFLGIPYTLRKLLYKGSFFVDPSTVEKLAETFKFNSYSQVGSKYHKFQQTILSRNLEDFFYKSSSYLDDESLNKLIIFPVLSDKSFLNNKPDNLLNFLGKEDMISYLPGDILTKVDRASMHVALETREPFLDPQVIKIAFTLPEHLKISKTGESKYILKEILKKYISPELVTRPKQGFTVPIEKWLKGFLKEDLILIQNDSRFFEVFKLNQGFFNEILKSFFAGSNKYNPHFIWFVYCLFVWYKKWL